MTLLRFITAGSVDDGKSTLIGRLLYDSQSVHEDQLAAAGAATRHSSADGIDLSLLTDGLRAEREQGITIDVAYRYFATERRKFILADTPGHEQYTRNMATAASTADLAILLVDARYGLRSQTRRHAKIASLLGIRDLVVAVNKMDLVGYDEGTFRGIESEFRRFATSLSRNPLSSTRFIPLSAFAGDNVVTASGHMPWFQGQPLLDFLETVDVQAPRESDSFYFPVQTVLRPDHTFRGYAGQIAGGEIRVGDEVVALPSKRRSRVRRIVTFDGDLESAQAPMSVTLELEDALDVGRGDVLCAGGDLPEVARDLRATLIWFGDKPLDPKASYLAKHTTRTVRARVISEDALQMNDIGDVELETSSPLVLRSYAENRAAGSFILIDRETNATVAAGLVHHAIERRRAGPAEGCGLECFCPCHVGSHSHSHNDPHNGGIS
ncbi:MAG TPA: GTP-binding protein [Thermoanaerobaculia bacterium]|nr:GTP-binding protein [Thermoanaerobaculia bacterium]